MGTTRPARPGQAGWEGPHQGQPYQPARHAPLRSYAAIGDGRTIALVADDGRVDWLALPDLDSASVFDALLDADRGGSFVLAPAVPFRTRRRYLPGTNVLETTFLTAVGTVRVVDLMSMYGPGLGPVRELQRRVEGVTGEVPMVWSVRPRFGYGLRPTRLALRAGVPVADSDGDACAVLADGAGTAAVGGGAVEGRFRTAPGTRALLALCVAHREPLVIPSRGELDERFALTVTGWREWSTSRRYPALWRDAVERSALVLKLLVYAPSGAIAAAASTSLPEDLGGERNWDYRFSWVRDSVFTLDALLRLGCGVEATAYFWYLMHATQLSGARLQPLYRLDGGSRTTERVLPAAGYSGSRPVRIGNAAARQIQLDTYGELLQTAWVYVLAGGELGPDLGRRLAGTADEVCRRWQEPDAGIWEVRSSPQHFTHSKMMCWVALDRAACLADRGAVPGRHRDRWREHAAACQDFVERHCFSPALGSYQRSSTADGHLDASVLLGLLSGYGDPRSARWRGTVDAVRRELGHGCHVRRYTGDDGLPGTEGAFVSCSFWLAESLARTGRLTEATTLMDQAVGLANDVGLLAEQVDPATGAFLGNLPQGLSHLALISAATTISAETCR